jgi:hypothetical protein
VCTVKHVAYWKRLMCIGNASCVLETPHATEKNREKTGKKNCKKRHLFGELYYIGGREKKSRATPPVARLFRLAVGKRLRTAPLYSIHALRVYSQFR